MSAVRIQKWLSQIGVASRREVESWIKEGTLEIDGRKANLGDKIETENAATTRVTRNGISVPTKPSPYFYWLLNKPKGFLSSRVSEKDKPCIYELPVLKNFKHFLPSVGRLDFLSEGLLLLTNHGDMNFRLCHPRFKLPRKYMVLADKKLHQEEISQFKKGIELEDGVAYADVIFLHQQNLGRSFGYWYEVIIYEGRNRLVRRLFEHFSSTVHRLIRTEFGSLKLPSDLKPGKIRPLRKEEVAYLKESTQL